MGYEPFRNSAWFGRKPRFTSFALFDQMQSDATFGQLDTVQKIHAAMVLASLSVECEQRYMYMYTAISKTCWFSSNPILLKRDICIFLKPKETLRALLFCQFSEYPCCCTRGHTKQSQHTLWTKNRFATLVGLVGNPVSRVFHVSTKCSPAATVQALSKDSCCYGTRLCICPVRTASDIQRFPKLLCSSVIPSTSWSVVFAFSCSQKIRFEPCCSVKFLKIHAAVLEIKLQTASLGSRKDCILFLCRSDWNSGCHCNIHILMGKKIKNL